MNSAQPTQPVNALGVRAVVEPASISRIRRAYDDMWLVRLKSAHGVIRDLPPSDASKWPFVVVYAHRPTRLVLSDGRAICMGAGDCCVLAAREDLVVRAVENADMLIVSIPGGVLGPYRRALDEAEGRSYPTSDGTARLVGELLRGLSDQVESYECASPARLAHHVVGFLALMCSEVESPEIGFTRRRLLSQAKEYIEEHLNDVTLTPERIASVQHVSSRTLHRLFESDGLTISGWVRARRLEHCRQDLVDPAFSDVPVSHIGSRWGLWDAAHFSRLFKSTYGLSPRAYRLAYRTRPEIVAATAVAT